MKKGTRVLSALLAIILGVSTLAGCNNGSKTNNTDKPQQQSEETGKTTLPIVTKPITLKYWAVLLPGAAATISNFNESDTYIELEKRTGIKIEFQHPAAGQKNEQFNLMVASNELPDIIGSALSYKGGGEKAIKDGVYLKLNDYIEKYGPNYKKVRNSIPDIAKQTIDDNGNMFCFYQIVPFEEVIFIGPNMKKEWLDELNLKAPTTIDEWYTVLKAFKDKKGATAPLVFPEKGVTYGNGVFVGAYDIGPEFYQKNGKINYGPIQPGFKEYLTTMNKWYNEGLIDKDFATRNAQAQQTLFASEKAGAIIASPDTMRTILLPVNQTVAYVPYPSLKAGDKVNFRQTTDYIFEIGDFSTAISASTKYPVEAVKWLDYGYGEEGHILYNFGIEGKSYTMVNGKPTFTDLFKKNPENLNPLGLNWRYKIHAGPFLRLATRSNPGVVQESLDIRAKWTNETGKAYTLPPVSLTADEGAKFSSIMNEINTYRDEKVLKFIMGTEPLSRFDEFAAQIKKMGIEDAIKIQQAALDRYNTRK